MNANEEKDLQKLKQHIESCPSIPPDSLVSRILLQRINEKLHPSTMGNGYQNGNGYASQKSFPPSQNDSYYTTSTPSVMKGVAPVTPAISARQSKKHQICKGPFDSLFKIIRIIVVDLPLTLLFVSLITTHLIHKYYTNYVTPMIEKANWADNDRLFSEFTYYDRPCDVEDVTASSIEEVIIRDDNGIDTSDDAVENFMVHGMSLFTNILDKDVSTRLRTYIRKRNYELSADEVIPLDTPDKRHSFGIDANEDPSVAEALNQIGTHTLLKETLEKLLGKDPAVAEITAITVEPGARAQGWHPDVKPQGSSIKYGQTFTHSYSLFIPLQDVTKRMGATELCPGTHYCGSDNLEQVCVKRGFQASESNNPKNAWKTGDGLMMNQKMWHRGGKYTNSPHLDNPDRVVFILTFISRPNFGKDHRQLSHGTYFHIHPFMYGHTFGDLKNAQVSMSFPFSMLRSIGLWKPHDANWGYDWVTSTALRVSNSENGYSYEELEVFVLDSELGQSIPKFLHGEVDEEGSWRVYLEETISNFRSLFAALYIAGVMAYSSLVLILDFNEHFQRRRVLSALTRFVVINLAVIYLAFKAAEVVKETQFCKSVDSNTIYSRPFLPRSSLTMKNVDSSEKQLPTTVPMRSDVLLGNRYDSKHIGNYVNFLDYHPGNRDLKQQYDEYADTYASYSGLPSQFQKEIFDRIDSKFNRFLSQNEFGEWTLMEEKEKWNEIENGLIFSQPSMGLMKALDKEVAILLASARFGTLIRSSRAMKRIALKSLKYFRDNVIRKVINHQLTEEKLTRRQTEMMGGRFVTPSLFHLPNEKTLKGTSFTNSKRNSIPKSNSEEANFELGDHVLFNYQGSGYWLNGHIIHKEHGNYGYVERKFDDGLIERNSVVMKNLKPYVPLVEGQDVAFVARECAACPNDYLPGSIRRVYPEFSYDLEYESGDVDTRINAEYIARLL